jgi:arylsulfatase
MAFAREKSGQFGEAVGKAQLYIDDRVVAEGPLKTQAGHFTLGGDGLCVGYDSDDKVTEEYEAPNRFTDGTILGVGVDVGDDVYLDLEKEAAGALARD